MNSTIVTAALLVAAMPITAHAVETRPVQANKIEWGAAPNALPPGGQIAVLAGDPSKAGIFVLRFKAPAGYKFPAHTHSQDESVTVISGSFHVGMGAKLDTKKSEKLRVGGFAHVTKGMQHFGWFSEPSVIQVTGMGPFDINYVNSADDPRNKSKKTQ